LLIRSLFAVIGTALSGADTVVDMKPPASRPLVACGIRR
jgi:hypothetical protein